MYSKKKKKIKMDQFKLKVNKFVSLKLLSIE